MNSFAVKAVVFATGMMLAFALMLHPAFRQAAPSNAATVSSAADWVPTAPALNRSDVVRLSYVREKQAMLHQTMDVSERLETFKRALSEGTIDSLQLLRIEYLRLVPDFRNGLLGELKLHGLDNLLWRFSEKDWENWPSAAVHDDGGPSEARLFLDDVSLVNPELGRFLETGALLFNGLYLAVMTGNKFDPAKELLYAIENAEELLRFRRSIAVPARLLLDPNILDSAGVRHRLKQTETKLLLVYMKRFPEEFVNRLELLGNLDTAQPSAKVRNGVIEFIQYLALETRQSARRRIAVSLYDSRPLRMLAVQDPEIRRVLAEFFLICAIDALETGQRAVSEEMLAISRKIQPDLATQRALGEMLARPQAEAEPQRTSIDEAGEGAFEHSAPEKAGRGAFANLFAAGSDIVRRGIEQLVMLVLLIFGVGFVGGRLLLVYLSRRSKAKAPAAAEQTLKESGQDRSYGGSLLFDEEEDKSDGGNDLLDAFNEPQLARSNAH